MASTPPTDKIVLISGGDRGGTAGVRGKVTAFSVSSNSVGPPKMTIPGYVHFRHRRRGFLHKNGMVRRSRKMRNKGLWRIAERVLVRASWPSPKHVTSAP